MVKKVRFRTRELILLTAAILVLINLVFFKYIYPSVTQRRVELMRTIDKYNSAINTQLELFYRNLKLLKEIASIKRRILFSKKNLEILQTSNVSTFDMSNILKELLVKSKVSVYEVTLSRVKPVKGHEIYSFSVKVMDKLGRIFRFMDLVENYSDNMYITRYTLKPKDGLYSLSLVVNFDYVRLP